MKRYHIIVGVTTAFLALIEVVSAMVAHFGTKHIAYYKIGNTVFTTVTGCVKGASSDICTAAIKTVGHIIYTNAACTHVFTMVNSND